jgi:hypothetical protein
MDIVNKELVHLDDEIVESLRKVMNLANDAVAAAHHFKAEYVKIIVSCLSQSLDSYDERKQQSILERLLGAEVCASKWVGAISYALMMRHKAELTVDKLLPLVLGDLIVGEGIGSEALDAARTRLNWLKPKWDEALSEVEQIHQDTKNAVKLWKAAIDASKREKKGLDSIPTYQVMKKMHQIANNSYMDSFYLPHKIKNMLLQLEAHSSPLYKAYSLHAMDERAEISQEDAMKKVQKTILTASQKIAQMIYFIDMHPVKEIAPWIAEDKIPNLVAVKNWVHSWDQVVSSAWNDIWQIMLTISMFSSIIDKKENEYKAWIGARDEAKKMFQSLYTYTYAIQKLYDYITKTETGWHSLPDEKKQCFAFWYPYEFTAIPDEEKETIEAALCIRYQFDSIFVEDVQDNPSGRYVVAYNQHHFAQISDAWMRFQTKLLELRRLSSLLFDTQEQAWNIQQGEMRCIRITVLENIMRWTKITILNAEKQIVCALRFMKNWPKDKKVSLLKANESLHTIIEMKNRLSDWSQAMSAARDAIQEIIDPLQALAIVNKHNTSLSQIQIQSILQSWCQCTDQITDLSTKIVGVEESWQALVTSQEISTTDFYLETSSVYETDAEVKLFANLNIYIRLYPKQKQGHSLSWLQKNQEYSPAWLQKNADRITEKKRKAIIATWGLINLMKQVWYHGSYLTGKFDDPHRPTIDSYGQIKPIPCIQWRSPCISYDWARFRNDWPDLIPIIMDAH